VTPSPQSTRAVVAVLTWEEHEFLHAIRSDTVWSKTKQAILDHGGSVSVAMMQQLAQAVEKSLFNLP